MNPALWITLMPLVTEGIKNLTKLLNELKANKPQPNDEVTQEQIDAALAEMDTATEELMNTP